MRRDTSDARDATRGQEAQQVLSNQAYIEAIDQLRQDVVKAWKACPIRDTEGQRLYLQLAKLTDKFDAILAGYVETGKLAEHKIAIDDVRDESGARRMLRKVI